MDWTQIPRDGLSGHSRGKRFLWIEDSTLAASGHAVQLPSSVSIMAALADYAADYDAGDGSEITVRYQLCQDGEMVVSGAHSFTP